MLSSKSNNFLSRFKLEKNPSYLSVLSVLFAGLTESELFVITACVEQYITMDSESKDSKLRS